MSEDRSTLAMPSFDDDLDDFEPRAAASNPVGTQTPEPSAASGTAVPQTSRPALPSVSAARTRREIDAVSRFPSRDVARDGQLNLKGPVEILDRFRALCKADRRAYYDMLEIMMDHYEASPPKG